MYTTKFFAVPVIFFFLVPPVFAQDDLILEDDPDEYGTFLQEQKAVDQTRPTALNRSTAQKGYEALLRKKKEEMAGFNAVLLPLSDEIFTIEGQERALQAQEQRNQEQRLGLQKKYDALRSANEKLLVREDLLKLDLKGIGKKLERLLQMTFRVKRDLVDETGKVKLLNLFSSLSPKEAVFRDFLLSKVQAQLITELREGLKAQQSLFGVQDKLTSVKSAVELMAAQLRGEEQSLREQLAFQQVLLFEKKNEQGFFSKRLTEAREEERVIQHRIAELASGTDYLMFSTLPEEAFIWPVIPGLGISTKFLDSDYETRFGIPHPGIDIPTDQLTPVRAALSGKVIKAVSGSVGTYSYLQLAHRDGFSTVYGHLYELRVQEGDDIQKGDILALSGGAIGTKGAGKLSTGPHLHFEMYRYGKAVNPELYLL